MLLPVCSVMTDLEMCSCEEPFKFTYSHVNLKRAQCDMFLVDSFAPGMFILSMGTKIYYITGM